MDTVKLKPHKGEERSRRLRLDKRLAQAQERGEPMPWDVPTPVSLRNERSRRAAGDPRRDEARRPVEEIPLPPRPVRADLTPEALAKIQADSAARVLVTAEEAAIHRRHGGNHHNILAHYDPRRGK
jgi:hypothetical protein